MKWPFLVAVVAGVLIGGGTQVWAFGTGGSRPPCDNIDIGHYNTPATDNTGLDAHHGESVQVHAGVSTGMAIYDEPVACIQISSLVINDQSQDNLEVGWLNGLLGLPYQEEQCSWTGHGAPYLFRAKIRNGTYYCTVYGPLTPNQSDGFGVADQNGDGKWTFTHNGVNLGDNPVQMSFSMGESETNAERFNTADKADAYFDGLYNMEPDGWHKWARSECLTDGTSTDPKYNNQLFSAVTVGVSSAPKQCSY